MNLQRSVQGVCSLDEERVNVEQIFCLPSNSAAARQISKALDPTVTARTPKPLIICSCRKLPCRELAAKFLERLSLTATARCDSPEVNLD